MQYLYSYITKITGWIEWIVSHIGNVLFESLARAVKLLQLNATIFLLAHFDQKSEVDYIYKS